MKKHNIFYLFLFAFLIFSCKRDDDPELSRFEQITQTWRVQSVSVNGVDDTVHDYGDYSFEFREDNTYTFFMPEERSGTWQFNQNETAVILDPDGDEEQVDIIEIQNEYLRLQFMEEANHKSHQQTVIYSLIPANN